MQTELADVVRKTLDIAMNTPLRAYQAVHSHGKPTTGSKRHEARPQEPEPEARRQKPPTTNAVNQQIETMCVANSVLISQGHHKHHGHDPAG